jgi:hypothetical protein
MTLTAILMKETVCSIRAELSGYCAHDRGGRQGRVVHEPNDQADKGSGLGRRDPGRRDSTHFTTQPDVLLYTSRRLHLDARDIVERDLGQSYEPYRYRYDGFKSLTRGSGRMILVPYSWSTSNAFALVLPDNDEVRIVFAPNF